ncbi:hypothetical protein M378DRAFT_169669 [Amanita muscaria Koide BX008]|uniref:Uncharacterized protein n=1 Tax=Amanita muscaria (strain Koide BX008) TaxID=946122 RepID=A0A0C2WS56_AMAMK|nr:hypothetical protein M378DRAFT_169669 [Amanita muscaria Koide BX008]
MEHLKSASTILSTPPTSHAARGSPGCGGAPVNHPSPFEPLTQFCKNCEDNRAKNDVLRRITMLLRSYTILSVRRS